MVLDSRGNYSVDDAEDFVHLDSHLFLDAIVMDGFIKSNCSTYSNGLFSLGMLPSIGKFHQRFQDMQLKIN
jgi:hypothetical protein